MELKGEKVKHVYGLCLRTARSSEGQWAYHIIASEKWSGTLETAGIKLRFSVILTDISVSSEFPKHHSS